MPPRLTVYYDAACGVCKRLAHRAAARDAAGYLALRPAQTHEGEAGVPEGLLEALHARTPDGRWLRGGPALSAVLEALGHVRLARLSRAPGLRALWHLGYGLMARTRGLWGRWVLPDEPELLP